jgi:dephospho-CoA kinase
MMVIGLTGGIAAGKSTVSKMIKEYNIPVIDTDCIARDIAMPGSNVLERIGSEFGTELINLDGSLNRKMLGDIVFNDNEKLLKLNSITHPEIKKIVIEEIKKFRSMEKKACVVDAALLIESNFVELVDYIILIYASSDILLRRLMNRDKISEGEAVSRINKQMSFEEKEKYADFIIDNSKDIEYTRNQLSIILKKLYIMEDFNV